MEYNQIENVMRTIDVTLPTLTEDDAVNQLLRTWNLEKEISPLLKKFGITFEVLKLLKDDDIKVLLPDDRLATRVLFRNHLQNWQKANAFGDFQEYGSSRQNNNTFHDIDKWLDNSEGEYTPTSRESSLQSIYYKTKDLELILKTTIKGNQILEFKELNKDAPLPKAWRIILCEVICEYFIGLKFHLKSEHFENISGAIATLFPSEIKETYYIPRTVKDGRTLSGPRGCLIDKYNNISRNLREAGLLSSKYTPRCKKVENTSTLETSDLDHLNEKKLWLKIHRQPWSEVHNKWKETYALRKLNIEDNEDNCLKEWPILRHSLGYTLIESDFAVSFAGKELNLFARWDKFCKDIIPIFMTDVKDKQGKEKVDLLEQEMTENTKSFLVLSLLNAVLVPTTRIPPSWKPSIQDATDSFVCHVITENDIKPALGRLRDKYYKLGLPFQPIIVVVGTTIATMHSFMVCFNDISYTLDSFLKAVDVIFKLFHALNLSYPKESLLMWVFIQKYFFGINLSSDKKSSALSNLLHRLKNN